MKKNVIFLATILAIVGCKLQMISNINWSDIISPTNKVVMATLNVEVMTCDDDDVNHVRQEFEKRGIQARYNRCLKDGMDDYAQFSMPINMIKENTQAPDKVSDIAFYISQDIFFLKTSSRFKTLLVPQSNQSSSQELKITKIEFELTNDTEQPAHIQPYMAFVDGQAVMQDIVEIQPYNKIFITLSDVANSLIKRSDFAYPVFKIWQQEQQSTNQVVTPQPSNPSSDSRTGTVIELN